MSASPVILQTVFGSLELRRATTPFSQSMIPLALGADSIRRALEEALADGDSMSVMNLALECGVIDSAFGIDDEAVVAALMGALEGGQFVAVAPGAGAGAQDEETGAQWSAYYEFQARVGKEFMLALRKHRVVPSAQVQEIRQSEDYDVVAAAEASAIIVRQAKSSGGKPAQAAAETLAKHLVDMRSAPGKRGGFMLLRAPPSVAERLATPEEVVTPAKLKKLKEQKEAVYEIEIERRYHDDTPVHDATFTLVFEGGMQMDGRLDKSGKALVKGVPNESAEVRFSPDARPFEFVKTASNKAYRGRPPTDAELDERLEAFMQGRQPA